MKQLTNALERERDDALFFFKQTDLVGLFACMHAEPDGAASPVGP